MPGYQSILVPLDGSSYSVQALPLAELFAKKTDAILHLVMVHQPAPAWFNPPEFPVDMTEFDAAAWSRESAFLEDVAQRFAATSGLRVRHGLLEGQVPSAIGEFVNSQGVDLVVMTTHGRGGITRLWLGSTADKLIRRLSIPVLVVPLVPDRAVVPLNVRRILVPLDGSALSASILEHAKTLARLHDAVLVLAMIVVPLPPLVAPAPFPLGLPPISEEARMVEDQRYLNAVRNRLRDEGLRVECRVLAGQRVAKRIVDLAGAERCDLIVLATHGASGLDRVFLGRVANQVVRTAGIPVLVLRPEFGARLPDSEAETVEESVSAAPSCSIR